MPTWLTVIFGVMGLCISCASAFVALQVYKIQASKHKFELYDRRIEVFFAVKSFLSSIFTKGKVDSEELEKYWKGIRQGYFLFGKDLREVLDVIYKKSLMAMALRDQFADLPVGEERKMVVREHGNIIKELTDMLITISGNFERYLVIDT
ncbi:MAG: hypothetical protein HY794_04135 [Desulfarculus sp.]|nr:hypothetical protein [Desulfarculus sp.]